MVESKHHQGKPLRQAVEQRLVVAQRRKFSSSTQMCPIGLVDATLVVPRSISKFVINRKKREIESYHSKLEFERRRRSTLLYPSLMRQISIRFSGRFSGN